MSILAPQLTIPTCNKLTMINHNRGNYKIISRQAKSTYQRIVYCKLLSPVIELAGLNNDELYAMQISLECLINTKP